MIPHTRAFKRLKDEAQTVLDFAIVVTYAVPSLKLILKQLEAGQPLPFQPDHFNSRPVATDKVRGNVKHYKEVLSRHIFLSSFSYFEAYFVDVLKEVIEFHGNKQLLSKHSLSRNSAFTSPEDIRSMRKLREYPTPSNRDSYVSHGRKLASRGYVFPSSILAQHGLRQLLERAESDRIRSVDIPDLVESVFQLPLDSESEIKAFHSFRKMRNDIAHGRPKKGSLHLEKAIDANNFLRNLALKIDRHITTHLFLVET